MHRLALKYSMKKVKYYYNTNSLRYEKLETPLRVKLLRVLGFLSAALVTAIIIVSIAYRYFPSANEKRLQQQNEALRENYLVLDERAKKLQERMRVLEDRDNDVYRAIFEANPIPDSARLKEIEQQKEIKLVMSLNRFELEESVTNTLINIERRMAFQEKAMGSLTDSLRTRSSCWPALPPSSR